jgi:hypothetical protein
MLGIYLGNLLGAQVYVRKMSDAFERLDVLENVFR